MREGRGWFSWPQMGDLSSPECWRARPFKRVVRLTGNWLSSNDRALVKKLGLTAFQATCRKTDTQCGKYVKKSS
jgi:hypothetical protein